MKIFGQTVARMYVSAVVLLLFLAGASAYLLGEFPYALIFSVLACSMVEMLVGRYYLGQKFKIPFSGIITGLIIGCVAPINAQIAPLLFACAIAMLSKFFIKMKSANIFNPAAVGLLALGLLSIGSSWWASASVNLYGVAVPFSLVLVIAAYECRRLVLAFSFIATSLLFSVLGNLPLKVGTVAVALLSLNYFFAFLMLTEPRTSPAKNVEQAAYGVLVAVIYFLLLALLPHFGGVILLSLLLGNLAYALYRKLGGMRGLSMAFHPRSAKAGGGSAAPAQ